MSCPIHLPIVSLASPLGFGWTDNVYRVKLSNLEHVGTNLEQLEIWDQNCPNVIIGESKCNNNKYKVHLQCRTVVPKKGSCSLFCSPKIVVVNKTSNEPTTALMRYVIMWRG